MKYISLFSGVEAASVAWHDLDLEPVAFSEIEKFPSDVLAKRFPDVPNLGDITKIDFTPYKGEVDLIVGGSPCFPAGSLVMTDKGLVPIEDVKVGDMVLTHKGRMRKVLRIGGKIADTILVKGQGSTGIECTPNHKFFSRSKTKKFDRNKQMYIHAIDEESEWVEAKYLEGRFWLNVCDCENIGIPGSAELGRCSNHGDIEIFTDKFFYLIGRYLGNGFLENDDVYGKRVVVSCRADQSEYLRNELEETNIPFIESEKISHYFSFKSDNLYDWISSNFGCNGEDGKNIPAWCLGIDEVLRAALVLGYKESIANRLGESFEDRREFDSWRPSYASRKLSIGFKMILGSLGYSCSTTCIDRNNCKRYYKDKYFANKNSAFFEDSGWYGRVRRLEEGRKYVMVYNLEVEDDHSYTIDGIAVHNCQSFSIAGNREGLAGESGLMFEYIRAVREVMPRYFIWENVPGALSSEGGAAFGQLLREMDDIGYGLAWRVLDAQFFGVAQRRRRVFLVGCLGDAGRAAEVLFEQESLRWDNPSSRDKRKALAEDAKGRSGESYTLQVRCGKPGGGKGALVQEDVSSTLSTSNVQTLFQPASDVYAISGDIARGAHLGQNGCGYNDDGSCYTLNTIDQHAVAYLPFNMTQITSKDNGSNSEFGDPCHTIAASDRPPHVIAMQETVSSRAIEDGLTPPLKANQGDSPTILCISDDNSNSSIDDDVSGTLKVGGGRLHGSYGDDVVGALCARDYKGVGNQYVNEGKIIVQSYDEAKYIVRKLTPTECERLQGFPDGFTDIGEDGNHSSDGARYKAMGNSMAVPVMRWIGKRILDVESKHSR